jgi:hypothetical protein
VTWYLPVNTVAKFAMYVDSCLIAFASFSVSVVAAPILDLTPPELVDPGETTSRFEPKLEILEVTELVAP